MGFLAEAAWSLHDIPESIGMLNVRVPIDIGTINAMQSHTFALATPMRVRELLVLAVETALGRRSPQDRRDRVLNTTLAGLERGDFAVEIDGRAYTDPNACVVCSESVRLRFFNQSNQTSSLPQFD